MTENINDKSIWDEIYRKTDFSPGWDRPGADPNLLELIRKYSKTPQDDQQMNLLDVGCGNGRNTPLAGKLQSLTGNPVRYQGADFAESAVAFCRKSFPDWEFYFQDMCADLKDTDVASSGPYEVIVDCGCFHAIPPEMREVYSRNIASLCASGGLFVIGAWFRTPERDGVDPQYFPFLYLSEWFFDEKDIEAVWGENFSLLESRVDKDIYPGFHDGFGYFALRKKV